MLVRANFRLTAAAIACLTTAPSFARADGFFSDLFGEAPRPAVTGGWITTVVRAPALTEAGRQYVPEASRQKLPEASRPNMQAAARDPAWTATVVALNTVSMTTGSIAHGAHDLPPAGPRLTGKAHALSGVASFYDEDQMTATGEHFNKRAMTAAHKTLPFGTRVRVTRVDTGGSVVVRINDRGPYKPGRIIDLSESAAETLGMADTGTTPVRLEVLGE